MLVRATADEQTEMNAWIEQTIVGEGGTDFGASLGRAFQLIEDSIAATPARTSTCSRVIMFLAR